MEQKQTAPDLSSKKLRIANLQNLLNQYSLDLFLKEQNNNLYNYQYCGEFLNRIFEEISSELSPEDSEESEKHWDKIVEIIGLPFIDTIYSHQLSGITRYGKIKRDNQKIIKKQIYKTRIFLNSLINKYGLESLKQEEQLIRED